MSLNKQIKIYSNKKFIDRVKRDTKLMKPNHVALKLSARQKSL